MYCLFYEYSVLFVCICVLNYCHRVANQLRLNISFYIAYQKPKMGQARLIVEVSRTHTHTIRLI
jgi:hypothetical protein